jgi:hypothetical protein
MTMILEATKVLIQFGNARAVEAMILSRQDDIMRVALKGSDDALVFRCLNGTWISEELEPVEISFQWQRRLARDPMSEADYLCSKELAARLIHLLLNGGEENELVAAAPLQQAERTLSASVI